ncbi:DUF1523 family protein [Jannaschia aquimarina]|uniref:DUF1523 domain-containing protein n=1 Tax=Jannaschia aquimarina TaxID=935700 RepID=A0A0D1EFM8_9RHOB|nr:DUF1523 family protein [Jannaschia aquimarina]KIT16474.1 hypothetical protein jaqu_17020 [Jannaschia aquimarina]SNT07698.1 Protein of unknown function [Jannaschia aquimarina]
MRWFKWIFGLTVVAFFGAWLHYTLPQHDIVRVVNTEIQRVDYGENSIFWQSGDVGADGTLSNRDVRFIFTIRPNGRASVYRNEDTGWGWPPYFKLDSSNLQAEASDLISTSADPQWVVLTHYGWRSEFLTIFPNAVGVRPVEGPDVTIVPWFNIVFLTLLAALLWAIGVRILRFRRRRIDPMLAAADREWDEASEAMAEKRRGFRAWLDTWKGKPRV